MIFSKTINLGSHNTELSAKNKIQTMNFITLFTILISAIYTAFYYFYLNEARVAGLNLLITIAYACGFIIMAVGAPTKAKIWFFYHSYVAFMDLYQCLRNKGFRISSIFIF